MAAREASRRARCALDARLVNFDTASKYVPPHVGWIKAIRGALGMTAANLAARLGVSRQGVAALEANEANGSIRLDTLRRAADALNCDLIYSLIPRDGSLSSMLERQAEIVLDGYAHAVDQSMTLEDQKATLLPSARRAALDRLIESGDLWRVSVIRR